MSVGVVVVAFGQANVIPLTNWRRKCMALLDLGLFGSRISNFAFTSY